MVDTRGHDLDPILLGAVQRDELPALVVGGGDHQVGAADDLALDPGAGLGIVAHARLRLHAIEGVERGDEGQVEVVLELVPDGARDPVVRVQHVGWLVLGGEEIERGVGERVDELGKS